MRDRGKKKTQERYGRQGEHRLKRGGNLEGETIGRETLERYEIRN